MAMSSFRRSTATENKNKGGGGRKGSFYDRISIPKEADGSVTLAFIRGEYKDLNPPPELIERDAAGNARDVINPFFKLKKHKRKILNNGREEYRDEPCSRGPDPHNPQPCTGCMAMDRGDKSVTLGDAYLFTVLHLALYHSHPLLDKQTRQIIMKKDNSGPVMVPTACEGRLCNFCRVSRGEAPVVQQGQDPWPGWQANQFTTQFGNRRYLEVGKSHLDNLGAFESIISSRCFNAQCGQQLVTDGFLCPTCHNMVIDMSSDPRPDDEINRAVQNPYPCLTCRTSVLLQEKVSCEFCEAAGRQFQQLSLFDTAVTLFKSGEGTKSQMQMRNYAGFEQMSAFYQQQGMLPQGKTIAHLIAETKPYEFGEMFKARSLEDQAKRLSLPPPGGAPQQQYSAYGQQPNYGQPQGAPPPQQQFYGPPPGQQVSPGGYALPPQQVGYAPQQGMPVQPAPGPQFAGYQPQQYQQPQTAAPVQQPQGPQPFVPQVPPHFGS